jgi:hypothetical protein
MSEKGMSRSMETLVIFAVASLLAAWFGYYRFEDPLAPKFEESGRVTWSQTRAVGNAQGARN